jgi:predicted PhzF superfamily epimerase YddE/YHI9
MDVLRYAAFTSDPGGGNPAGVVLDAGGLDGAEMQAIAADVGYSETAFLTAKAGEVQPVRYFSPKAEVPFCGHATVATAVALAERTAAAFGAYLRELGKDRPTLTLHQGDDLGRPSLITVELRPGDQRVRVSGTAVRITEPG